MAEPRKWRETIDPYSIKFKNFKIIKVLGYPHARNDIFYVKGIFNNKNIYAYVKCCKINENDFKREISFLNDKNIPNKPKLLDYDLNEKYMVVKAVRGKKLSQILNDNKELSSLKFLSIYGEKLAKIHKLEIKCGSVEDRKFFHIPSEEYCNEYGLMNFRKYLIKNKPSNINYCFCHGDMHYANVLWYKNKIVAILDYELSGIGNKEFDIAWTLIRRPGQKFMKTQEEIDSFLSGYSKINDYNYDYVKFYMIQIYLHFYKIGINDKEYIAFVNKWLEKTCI